MVSLAAWRYGNILTEDGGPVKEVRCFESQIFGVRSFEAHAYLVDGLMEGFPKLLMDGTAAGAGNHRSAVIAKFMAISEAIERWAFVVSFKGPNREIYGFDRDPSTSGMAAFPGLFNWQCRRRARLEAIERYCLRAWWGGLLKASVRSTAWPGVNAVVLSPPFGLGGMVVVLEKECAPGGFWAYGQAAGADFKSACARAAVELWREEENFCGFFKSHPGYTVDDVMRLESRMDRNLLYFSLPIGHASFLEHVDAQTSAAILPPETMFDGPIAGPWSRYATVWRVAFQSPTGCVKDKVDFVC
jgi:hypothetical protein